MHDTDSTDPGKRPADPFDSIAGAMTDFRDEMQNYNVVGTRIAARTLLILRSVFTILFLSSIYIVFLIYKMSVNMSVMTGHLDNMYGSFTDMSGDMHGITTMVDSMGKSISGIPVIATSMLSMQAHVSAMNDSVDGMNGSMSAIDNDMYHVDSNMREMSGRLAGMNGAVNSMGHDVYQMSQPMNSGPLSGFWPH